MSTSDAPARVYVSKRVDFTNGSRQLISYGTRNIAVVCYRDVLYAIDNACYHHGGPLLNGDIEDMGGHPCIVCPWHSYKIALDTGEGLYMGIEGSPTGGKRQEIVRSKGCKQRTHKVEVDAAGDVYVLVDLTGPGLESDRYASMELANQQKCMSRPVDGGVRGPRAPGIHSRVGTELRSGHVFKHRSSLPASTGESSCKGTNPLSGRQRARSPISPTLHPVHHSSPDTLGDSTTGLKVTCVSITNVCPQVRQFDFVHYAGPLPRRAELGEYVELELPIKESCAVDGELGGRSHITHPLSLNSVSTATRGELMRRRWTVCEVNNKGTLFSVVVQATSADTQTSGSAWLHSYSLHVPLSVVRIGGNFTFAGHRNTIHAVGGRILWITAGACITTAYAFLNASLGDSYFVETAEALNVLHFHETDGPQTVPKMECFLDWQRSFPRPVPGTDKKTSTETDVKRSNKNYVMELFISTTTLDGNGKSAKLPPPMRTSPNPITHHRRMQPADVIASVHTYFGSELPLAYVCGPPSFVRDYARALDSTGIEKSRILTLEL